jgi:hypothetical protein
MVFNWEAVEEADAYVFTLFQQTAGGRKQILRTEPLTDTSYTLENLSILDNGTFIWQIEAVGTGSAGTVERRGRIAETTFHINFPPPSPVQADETGILYGN